MEISNSSKRGVKGPMNTIIRIARGGVEAVGKHTAFNIKPVQ
jgi:hypothetical protein